MALTKYLSEQASLSGEPAGSEERARRILEGLEKTNGLFMVVIDMYKTETSRMHMYYFLLRVGEKNLLPI